MLLYQELQECQGTFIPVLAFGSSALGWVPKVLCKPFHQEAALASYNLLVQSTIQDSSLDMGESQQSGCNKTKLVTLSRRLLKFALQYYPTANTKRSGKRMIQEISLQYISDRLLDLEADIPAHLLGNASFSFWTDWRRRVSRSESSIGLASEVHASDHYVPGRSWYLLSGHFLRENQSILSDPEINHLPAATIFVDKKTTGDTILR